MYSKLLNATSIFNTHDVFCCPKRGSNLRHGSINPSQSWYQFADPERIAVLVSPDLVEQDRTQYLRIASALSKPLHHHAR